MPNPVSSGARMPGLAKPSLDEPSQASTSAVSNRPETEAESASSQAPAVGKLVSSLPSPPVALPPAFADYGLSCGARDALFAGVVAASASVEVLNSESAHEADDSSSTLVDPFAAYVDAAVELVRGPNNLLLGFSPGVSAAGSISIRDVDHDGKPEICLKASSDPLTLGFCIEVQPL